MSRAFTPREKDLMARSTAIEAAIQALDIEWPLPRREELAMTEQGRAMVWIYERDRQALAGAKAIIDALFTDADGFAVLFQLAATKKWAFDSCVLLAKQELAAKDQPAEVAA